jgi:CSLREA domain-containing protein
MQTIPQTTTRFLVVLLLGLVLGLPAQGANFVVNSSGDADDGTCNAGHCSLREAIDAANSAAGPDLITFDLGSASITPASPLPVLTGGGTTIRGDLQIALDGSSIAAAFGDGLAIASDGNRIQGLEVHDFPGAGILVGGFSFQGSASNNVIGVDGDGIEDALEGNTIHSNGSSGIEILGNGAAGNVVAGNHIGTNTAGTSARPNFFFGVQATHGSTNTRIGTDRDGTSDDLERNVISGNDSSGVAIDTSNEVAGNYIGFEANGSDSLGNAIDGITVVGASNTIGPGNVIGNNGNNGISLTAASFNLVFGNAIGTDVARTEERGNGSNGIRIFGLNDVPALNNRIGIGPGPGGVGPGLRADGNVIAHNGGHGVYIDSNAENFVALDNSIMFNSIHSNEGLGIDLLPNTCPIGSCSDGVTPNDSGDTDGGGNSALNFPDVKSATTTGSNTNVSASITDGLPNRDFTIQFFANAACDPSGNGEGETYLGQVRTTTDGAGNASVFVSLPVAATVGDAITTTATQRTAFGLFPTNTSEFSACFPLVGGTFVLAANVIRDLLMETADNGMMDVRWAARLERRVDRAERLASLGAVRAARLQLRVFQIIVRVLHWTGEVSPAVAQPLLASSRAAQEFLGGARPHPPRRWRHDGPHP